jgi:hypothetical protein
VAAGQDPICAAFEPGQELIELEAGQFLSAAAVADSGSAG